MRKLYGEAAVSREGGVTKQLKGVATRNAGILRAAQDHPRVKEMRAELERVQKDASTKLDQFGSRFDEMVQDTRTLIQRSTDRLLIVRTGNDVATIDRSQYSLEIQPSKQSGKHRFHLGEPISVKWRAPKTHSRRDWIGVYLVSRLGGPRVADEERLVTKISSQGKWLGVAEDEWDGDVHTGSQTPRDNRADDVGASTASGVTTFKAGKLPWQEGIYEVRYHHDAKHNVLARSGQLEIYGERVLRA